MSEPLVAIVPSTRVKGADTLDDDVQPLEVVPLSEALLRTYETDTHLQPAIALPREPDDGQPRLNKPVLSALEEVGSRIELQAVFIDIDNDGHASWTPSEAHAALEDLIDGHSDEGGFLEKAAVYATRGGWRAVYTVDPPIPAPLYRGTLGHPGRAEKNIEPSGLLKWFGAALEEAGGPGRLSWRDGCNQWTRIYRAPRVVRDDCPTDPLMLDLEGFDAGPLDVSHWLAEAEVAPPTIAAGEVDLERPEFAPVLSAIDWAALGLDGSLNRRMPATGSGKTKLPALDGAIRRHIPWWGPGERNSATFDGVCLIAEVLYTVATLKEADRAQTAAELIYRAVAPCVSKACTTGVSATPEDESLDETWRMVADRVAVEEAKWAKGASRAVIAKQARQAAAQAMADAEDDGDTADYEDDEELPEPVEPDELNPIVVVGAGYYILDAREPEEPAYFPYTKNPAMWPALLLRGCGDVNPGSREGPLGLKLRNAESGKLRPMMSLVIDYGAQVTDVVVAHGTKVPRIDVKNHMLQIPGAQIVASEPRYYEQIARWLELIAGDEHEALLDWLATVTRLDSPTCALYLQGKKGVGKGLFASCVASVFGRGFVTFKEACSRFNDGLNRTPVVFLDEKMSESNDVRDVSGAFRSLVAETEHRTEGKGAPIATLRGATRVIIGANNPDALPMVGAHTEADLDAVASRIRWIGCDPEAAEYLRQIGGRATTAKWLGPVGKAGWFANHVHWLEKNREVEVGPRFLVEGVLREYHKLLAMTSDRRRVLHAVGAAILRGTIGMKQSGVAVEPDGKHISVNVTKLRTQWLILTGDARSPTQGIIVGAIKALVGSAAVQVRRDDVRAYLIPIAYLRLAAEQMGLPVWRIDKHIDNAILGKGKQIPKAKKRK